MRKRLITPSPHAGTLHDEDWLDLDREAVVDVTSEADSQLEEVAIYFRFPDPMPEPLPIETDWIAKHSLACGKKKSRRFLIMCDLMALCSSTSLMDASWERFSRRGFRSWEDLACRMQSVFI